MAKLTDILKTAGDVAGQVFLGRLPESQWIPQMRGPYDPYNGIMRDIANVISPTKQPEGKKLAQIQKTVAQPTPTPSVIPSPTPYPRITADQVRRGLRRANMGQDPPISEAAEAIAEVGNELPGNINPFFPAAVAGKESTFGKFIHPGSYNPLGIMSYKEDGTRELASYPDYTTAFKGGGPRKQYGFKGTLHNGAYDDFLKSGDYGQFLDTYTPEGDGGNAPIEEQKKTLNKLLESFTFD